MNWYYAKNGNQNGPLPTEDMKDRIAMGEIAQTDLAWCEGMGDWLPVSEIPQLKVEAPQRTDLPADAGSPVAASEASPYRAPTAAAAAAVPAQMMPGQMPSQGLAIGSLVCGILGLLGCCVPIISLPAALAAIVTGHLANSKIKGDDQRFAGKGMARVGLITGYLGLICSIISAVLVFNLRGLTEEQTQDKILEWFPESMERGMREQLQKQNESR